MFRAKIQGGKLSFGRQKPVFLDFLAGNEGRTVTLELERKGRSTSQNAYYWVYLGVIGRETGHDADDLHEFFKRKLLPPVFKKVLGNEVTLPMSTTVLKKAEFGDYLDKISALTGVPLPDKEAAGYISNYGPMTRAR